MSLYLVTGGAGFIGSNIVEALVKKNKKVRVLDSLITGKIDNLKPFMDKIEFVKGDIRDNAVLDTSLKGVDYVLHQAALRSVAKSVEDPEITNDININGTLKLFLAAHDAKVKRVVYASSSSVYGETKKFPERESDAPSPISPYAVSKLAGEYYGKMFTTTYKLETVGLRYFNVFGPRQNPESRYSAVIPAFISRMLNGESPIVDSDGKQARDFTYVENVVEANLKAATAKNIAGMVFNVGCGESYDLLYIIKVINNYLGTDIKPVFAPKRPGDVRKTIADIRLLKKKLGTTLKVRFDEGLERTIKWFETK